MTDPMTYKSAGVDLDAAERAKRSIKSLVSDTGDANTLSELGAFGGLYRVPGDVTDPVLVSSADGVGTKLKLAFMTGRHDTVGQDLVNHCVNDILVQGARPLFFMDYLATGVLDEGVVPEVVGGVSLACRQNGCALLGGETAQMPDFYGEGEYDLAGFIVGIVSEGRLLDGTRVDPDDRLVALPSTGLHTNGYTLARSIVFDRMGLGRVRSPSRNGTDGSRGTSPSSPQLPVQCMAAPRPGARQGHGPYHGRRHRGESPSCFARRARCPDRA